MKAMLLAAGRGERMRPLTNHTPKCLLPVGGKPLIVYHLEKLAQSGIRDVIINVSYLAEKIQKFLGDGSIYGVRITYSYEPEPLETGGGIYQALPLLGKNPFLVISSDLYTDYPFATLRGKLQGMAHLILAPNPDFHPVGDFSLLPNGLLSNKPAYTYASFGVFHPALFQDCQPGRFSYIPLIRQAIDQQQVTGELYRGLWCNVGSIVELTALNESV